MVSELAGGGAPLHGERLALDLANTSYAARGRPVEGLRSAEHLGAWLRDVRPRLEVAVGDADLLAVTEADVEAAIRLRTAIRALAGAATSGDELPDEAVATVNAFARTAPHWRELRPEPKPHVELHGPATPVAAALAAVAEDAVALFGGPDRLELRPCSGPGCVLFFLRSAARREYCSSGCGNRARAARHYARTRG